MIRKKRYLAVGLLAMGISIIFSGQTAEAAEKKTIYNSPYVSFSPDGKAFTTCAGDQNYTWYDNGTTVNTGIKSSLRNLETGEHYYAIRRSGEVPVGYWKVVHRPGNAYMMDILIRIGMALRLVHKNVCNIIIPDGRLTAQTVGNLSRKIIYI